MNTKPIILTDMDELTAYRLGCQDARDDEYCWLSDNPLDSASGAKARRAHRIGFLAESARIANRRMTGAQRDLLIAHDRAVAAFKAAPAHLAHQDDAFIAADLALFGLNPWETMGIRLGQYECPAYQAHGKVYA